jgi:peptide subunit release factor 1 (eRF1)
MISLMVPAGDAISSVHKMLEAENGTSARIKSRVNR